MSRNRLSSKLVFFKKEKTEQEGGKHTYGSTYCYTHMKKSLRRATDSLEKNVKERLAGNCGNNGRVTIQCSV